MTRPRQRSTAWSLLALALVVSSSAVIFPGPAVGQPPGRRGEPPFGEQTHVFRRLLYDLHFKPVSSYEHLDPPGTILVLLGNTSVIERQSPDFLGKFIDDGGAVLLATDRQLAPESASYLEQRTRFSVSGFHFQYAGGKDASMYHNLRFCPILEPVAGVLPNLFHNPGRNAPDLVVATNVPSHLAFVVQPRQPARPPPAGVTVLANLPPDTQQEMTQERMLTRTFLISWQPNRGGRMLVLADHSIFINQMMLPDDNNNVEFTANCMEWLSEDGKRKKVLFVEEGKINPTFDVPLQEVPLTMPPDLERRIVSYLNTQIDHGNDHLQDAEERDLFNTWIHRILTGKQNVTPWHAVGVLFVVLTLVGLVVGFFRLLFNGFQQQQPMAPSLARLVQQQVPAESLMEQRNQGMFQVRNMWEVGRQAARQAFEAAGVAGKADDPLPPVAVSGGWWERYKARREVGRLWALAFGTKPLAVSPAQWPALLRRLGELRTALANGKVRLG